MKVSFFGVKTNNLKNIDVRIAANKITAITGVSGGGKSSLAYETIYRKCRNEFLLIDDGGYEEANYIMDRSENLMPAVAIQQKNLNSNPRSTIYSFLSLYEYLVAAKTIALPNKLLKLNKPGNECPECCGSRISARLDIDKVIDADKRLLDNPFNCWQGAGKSKYTALILKVCDFYGIDKGKKFFEISNAEQDLLLSGESEDKFQVSYLINGKRRSRSERYIGALRELKELLSSKKISEFSHAEKFCSHTECSHCLGSGLNKVLYDGAEFLGVSFFEFLTKPIDSVIKSVDWAGYGAPILSLQRVLEASSILGIGYLSLSRSIPSLSGGELQKLKFGKVLSSQISNVIFVIDEISSQVNMVDHESMFNAMREVCFKGNTIILVEHCRYFIDQADEVINIGPGAGKDGGHLIDYVAPKHASLPLISLEGCSYFNTPRIWSNNVKGVSVRIPMNRLTGIYGVSGSGKSSFAKGLAASEKKVIHVTQNVLRGNSRSTVSTYMGLSDQIADLYSEVSGHDRDFFLAQSGKDNVCKTCDGASMIEYARGFEGVVKIECPACDGNRFSNLMDDVKFEGLNICEFYKAPLMDAEKIVPKKLKRKFNLLISLGLGHLSLGRKVASLSGGESKRLKMAKHLAAPKEDAILIVDEPGAGLDEVTALKVLAFIKSHSDLFKSIIVIDHKEIMLSSCDYCICFGPKAGEYGGEVIYIGGLYKAISDIWAGK
ncbi:MAG: hypothetical protein CMK73_02085 [Pseudomonadales bacterium]|nr:hypothetical protein [Pseudomonadales bacterium]|tara:strand:- start:2803 stop:4959 length:2157 start_codon:yes stop_codon:yes gene_type:complete